MTCRRKLLLLAPLAVAVPILAMVGFVFRHDSAGWARGEASYKGKYTGQWSAEIAQWSVVGNYKHGANSNRRIWAATRTPGGRFREFLFCRRSGPLTDQRLLDGDPAAIPVLLELLQDEKHQVRLVACQGLGDVGPDAKAAVPGLQNALKDADAQVKSEAEWALLLIGVVDR